MFTNILHHYGACSDHAIGADLDVIADCCAGSNPSAFADPNGSGQVTADGDVDVIFQNIVVIHRGTGIDNAAVPDGCIGINHCSSHNDSTTADRDMGTNYCAGVNKRSDLEAICRESALDRLANGWISNGNDKRILSVRLYIAGTANDWATKAKLRSRGII